MRNNKERYYPTISRGNIISENIVIMTVATAVNKIKDVDCIVINSINYTSLMEYIDLESAYVWGIKYNDQGLLKTIDLTNPIQRDLDGYGIIHKSHKMFAGSTAGKNPIQFAKEHLTKCIEDAYIEEKSINETQKAMLQAG